MCYFFTLSQLGNFLVGFAGLETGMTIQIIDTGALAYQYLQYYHFYKNSQLSTQQIYRLSEINEEDKELYMAGWFTGTTYYLGEDFIRRNFGDYDTLITKALSMSRTTSLSISQKNRIEREQILSNQ